MASKRQKILQASKALFKAQSLCIDLMDDGVMPEYSIDIVSMGETITQLERETSNLASKTKSNGKRNRR